MKLLIPPDPIAELDYRATTPELWQRHLDWIWKWKPWLRHMVDDGFLCHKVYGKDIPDTLEPHAYDLVDYFAGRWHRVPIEYWSHD